MSTALQIVDGSGFSDEQVAIIKSQVAPPGTTNDELKMFLMYCQRTGLDPFARQIYLSERRSQVNGNWSVTRKPETTIDGFRLIAERSGQYAGQTGPFWCGEDGAWRDVWIPTAPPVASRVGILRHDFKEPLWAVALYDEYCQKTKEGKPNSMWAKMPANQLAKCAESLALRRAFPRELSGLYSKEEMDQGRYSHEAQEDVAQRRIEELKQAKALPPADFTYTTPPEEIQHLNEELNRPADPPLAGYEQRATEKAAEAQQVLADAPKAGKTTKPAVSFDMLEAFAAIKKQIHEHTGSDNRYYGILKGENYEKSSLIPSRAEGTRVYKLLVAELNALKQKAVTVGEIEERAKAIGPNRFASFLRDTMKLTDDEFENADDLKFMEILALMRELKYGDKP